MLGKVYVLAETVDRSNLERTPHLCEECPEHARCGFNTTLTTLLVPPDYWRLSPHSWKISKCGDSRCRGGVDAGVNGEGYCAAGHTGPLCLLCQEGEALYWSDGGDCVPCPDVGGATARVIGVAVALSASVALLLAMLFHPKCQRVPGLQW